MSPWQRPSPAEVLRVTDHFEQWVAAKVAAMTIVRGILALLLTVAVDVALAADVRLVNVEFTGPVKPFTEVDRARNFYTNHFSVSASYEMNVKVEANVPANTTFAVRTFAVVGGKWISLGGARLGRADGDTHLSVGYHIFPSTAKYFGPCQFVVRADADNEIKETDEGNNDWAFQATVHPPQ
jgi:hypothetical protein